jgi:hypothetical protein
VAQFEQIPHSGVILTDCSPEGSRAHQYNCRAKVSYLFHARSFASLG